MNDRAAREPRPPRQAGAVAMTTCPERDANLAAPGGLVSQ